MIHSDKIKYFYPFDLLKYNGKININSKFIVKYNKEIQNYNNLLDKLINKKLKIQNYNNLYYNGLLDKTTFGRNLHAKTAMFWYKLGFDKLSKSQLKKIKTNSTNLKVIIPDFTHSIYKGNRLYSIHGIKNRFKYNNILENKNYSNINNINNILESSDDYYNKNYKLKNILEKSNSNSLNNDSIESRNNSTKLDETIPINVIKEDVLLITPTLNKMANPIKNEKVAISLFNYKNIYFSNQFTIPFNLLNKCKAIWFFGHGLNHYDKLDIYISNDKKYNMENFFIDNPNIKNIDFIFDVCYSSSLLIDFNFMNEVNNRNIRLYTCGFIKELNTKNGSFLTYCLKSLKNIIGNPFLLTVKQINAWFSIISDICGYKMYCYGKDDSNINPTLQEKQLAYILIKPYLINYFNGIIKINFKGYDLTTKTRNLIYNKKLKSKSFGIN